MSALFAFEVGDVSMKSPTFEAVMADTMAALSDPGDKQIIAEALVLNALWVDDVAIVQKEVLPTLYEILGVHLSADRHAGNDVARLQIRNVMDELERRYPDDVVRGRA